MPAEIHAEETVRALRVLESNVLAAARQVLGQTTSFALELARRTTKFKDRTEVLRRSIRRVDGSTWRSQVLAGGADAPWGKFVEDGTKAHVIEAKNGQALHFVWNGVPVFFRRVHHPGTKPAHFMLETRDEAEQVMGRFMESGLRGLFT